MFSIGASSLRERRSLSTISHSVSTGKVTVLRHSLSHSLTPDSTVARILQTVFTCSTGRVIPVPTVTTAARICAAVGATVPSASRRWSAASASTTGAVMSSARSVADGWTLKSVTDKQSKIVGSYASSERKNAAFPSLILIISVESL